MNNDKLTTKYRFSKESKGIYVIHINGKPYVGKDSHIAELSRIYNHLSSLRRGTHFNEDMQKDFNTYGESAVTYSVLFLKDEISDSEIVEVEKEYINRFDSINNGYNKMDGYSYLDDLKEKRSVQKSGENHHNAKISNQDFYDIVELFKAGKTNEEIGELYGLHERYVSLIRHKKRFKRLWEGIDYTPEKSNKRKDSRRLDYQTYCDIRDKLNNGFGNRRIEALYNLSSGSASRIRNGLTYKDYYTQYAKEHNK